jgi:hypothetical protein
MEFKQLVDDLSRQIKTAERALPVTALVVSLVANALNCARGENSPELEYHHGAGGQGGLDAGSMGIGGEGGNLLSSTVSFNLSDGGPVIFPCGLSDVDDDGDGFTENGGDCNDCDENVNPDAVEVPTAATDGGIPQPQADEDCDGLIDEEEICDTGLLLESPNPADAPFDAAKAIDLCHTEAIDGWGVMEAAFVRADGTTSYNPQYHQYGIKSQFGFNVKPQKGDRLLTLSTGKGRDASDPDACGKISCVNSGLGALNPLMPQDPGSGCPKGTEVHDEIALKVKVQVPSNAHKMSFDFKFFTFEFPNYICQDFNDQFGGFVIPAPVGSINGNIAFDAAHRPISVNNLDFLTVCLTVPGTQCLGNIDDLLGTGFDTWQKDAFLNALPGAASEWLSSEAPVTPNDVIEVLFVIFDTDDANYDSTVLIDNFRWGATPGTTQTTPIENPK